MTFEVLLGGFGRGWYNILKEFSKKFSYDGYDPEKIRKIVEDLGCPSIVPLRAKVPLYMIRERFPKSKINFIDIETDKKEIEDRIDRCDCLVVIIGSDVDEFSKELYNKGLYECISNNTSSLYLGIGGGMKIVGYRCRKEESVYMHKKWEKFYGKILKNIFLEDKKEFYLSETEKAPKDVETIALGKDNAIVLTKPFNGCTIRSLLNSAGLFKRSVVHNQCIVILDNDINSLDVNLHFKHYLSTFNNKKKISDYDCIPKRIKNDIFFFYYKLLSTIIVYRDNSEDNSKKKRDEITSKIRSDLSSNIEQVSIKVVGDGGFLFANNKGITFEKIF
ncbi:MAG: hypothetical protein LBE20_03755 [Deltaproteobacteria bacterium]|nr:hypothetical protein [Deltaproteobacteria bacterium]